MQMSRVWHVSQGHMSAMPLKHRVLRFFLWYRDLIKRPGCAIRLETSKLCVQLLAFARVTNPTITPTLTLTLVHAAAGLCFQRAGHTWRHRTACKLLDGGRARAAGHAAQAPCAHHLRACRGTYLGARHARTSLHTFLTTEVSICSDLPWMCSTLCKQQHA